MKNKKLAYFLLPVVLLVWGIAIYKIVKAFEAPDAPGVQARVESKPPAALISSQDTFQLVLQYPDPFLSGRKPAKAASRIERISQAHRPASQSVPQPVVVPVQWPQIEYMGYIENKKTHTKIAMMKIGGHDQLLDEGKSAFGVKVVRVYPDSIKLNYEKEVMFVRRGY